jgi:hypothetical protein
MYEQASYTVGDPTSSKNILANSDDVTTRKVIILTGQNLAQGAVLGKISEGEAEATPGAAVSGSGGTVGNGSIGTVTVDAGAQEGIYQVRILNAASNAGTFEVIRPDGTVDGNGTVAVPYNGMINFTLADGSNDWVEDDRIPVTVTNDDGTDKYVLSLAAATDGSEEPDLVLAYAVDASAADKEAIAYETATVVSSALVIGTGHTLASIREGLRLKGIKIDDGD